MHDLMLLGTVNSLIANSQDLAIIMDEIDGMGSGPRSGLNQLLEFIMPNSKKRKNSKKNIMENKWGPPVICICNTGGMKKTPLHNLTKICHEIKFTYPSTSCFKKVIHKIINCEKIKITDEAIDLVVKYSQRDYRRLTFILQHLNEISNGNITIDTINFSYDFLCKKEQDLHITDSIKKIINDMHSYNDVMKIYQKDKSKAPMVVHENYISAISFQKVPLMKKLNNALNCIDSIINSDIIEKTMFNTQEWDLQTIQGILSCYIPSYYINSEKKSKDIAFAKWASVLGRTSQMSSDKNNIYDLILKINQPSRYGIFDIQMLSERIFYYLTHDQVKKGALLMKQYNIEIPDLTQMKRCIKLSNFGELWKSKTIDKTAIKHFCKKKQMIVEHKNNKFKSKFLKITKQQPKSKSKSKNSNEKKDKSIIKKKIKKKIIFKKK